MDSFVLSIVVAMTADRIIGNRNELPWHLPSDLERFRRITLQSGTVIMGRRTYDSILARNGKPLSDRRNIVLTRKPAAPGRAGVVFVESVEAALEAARQSRGKRACVIGGGEIYRLFLPVRQVRVLHITMVHAEIRGDTHFPALESEWKEVASIKTDRWHEDDDHETSYAQYFR